MGERGCGGFDPLGLRRDSPTAWSRGSCREGTGCGTEAQGCIPVAWSPQTAAVLRGGGTGGVGRDSGSHCSPCPSLWGHLSRVTPSQVPS